MFRHAPLENKRGNANKRALAVRDTGMQKPFRATLHDSTKQTKEGVIVLRDQKDVRRSIKVLGEEDISPGSFDNSVIHAGFLRLDNGSGGGDGDVDRTSDAFGMSQDQIAEQRRIRNAYGVYGDSMKPRLSHNPYKPDIRPKRIGVGGAGGGGGVGDDNGKRRLLTSSSPAVAFLALESGDTKTTGRTGLDDLRESKRQWHHEQQRRQHAKLENDSLMVDQGSLATVGQLLGLLLSGSVWPEHSPLVVQYWVTQLSASFTLTQCIHQLLMNRAQLTYNSQQHVALFEQAPLLCVPLELLETRAKLALQAMITAFTVNNSVHQLKDNGSAVPRDPFFSVRSISSNGQCLEHHRGFRFNHVLEHMLGITRIALVRDMACEVLRVGFRVMASSVALESVSCALQQAFCQVRRVIQPLEERALRGATLDTYLERKELEELFRLQQREQLLLTLIGCAHRGVLHALVAQYVMRGERAMHAMQAAEG